ncbi:MAG: hypothetical protein U9P68_11740 [Pseudomonadota bacterium]|nr:hypothetical protein [Pseudomonadota bacterium]
MSDKLIHDEEVSEGASVEEVAGNLLAWAKRKHLFSSALIDEAVDYDEIDENLLPQRLFESQSSADILRNRSVNLIGFNSADRRIVIYTNRKLTKKNLICFRFIFLE